MTLLYADGFDQLAGLTTGQINTYWNADGWYYIGSGTNMIFATADGVFGGKALYFDAPAISGEWFRGFDPVTLSNSIIMGFRWTNLVNDVVATNFLRLRQAATTVIEFSQGDLGEVVISVAGTTYRSAVGLITRFGTAYIQIKYTLSTGHLVVKANGDTVIDIASAVFPALTQIDNWGVRGGGTGTRLCQVDDVVIIRDDAVVPNDYLGNVRVRNRAVVSNGDTVMMSPVGAATNWEAVTSPNLEKASYVSTSAVGDFDLYGISSGPDSRNIYAVYLRVGAWQADATQLRVSSLVKTNSTVFESADQATQSSARLYNWSFGLNPDTGLNWTNSEVNLLQIGGKLAGSD
jgi:hypothetical protein